MATSSVRLTAHLNSELSTCYPCRPTSECSIAGSEVTFSRTSDVRSTRQKSTDNGSTTDRNHTADEAR